MSTLKEILEAHSLFSPLPIKVLESIVQRGQQRSLSDGEILLNQGVEWPYLFIVLNGEVNAVKESPEGRYLIAGNIKAGEIFWGLAFFIAGHLSPMVLQASAETKICVWSRDFLTPIIRDHGEMSWELSQNLIKRMLHASGIVDDLAFQPVMGRLAGLILDQFSDAGDAAMARFLTLDDMAARIGTTREMVCRYLQRFSEQGAIELSRTEIRIVDRGKLGG